MPVTKQYRAETMQLLNQVTDVTDRAMFGGVGLYSEGLFFALMDNDKLYFKVDDSNRPDYEALAMGPFYPFGDESMVMQYYEVPEEVLDEPQTLREWIGNSVAVARAKKQKNAKKK
jgi:DNA transformation protein